MEGALPHGYQSRAGYLQGWHSSHFGPKNSSEEPTPGPGPGRDGFAGMPRRCRSTSAGDNRAGWTASCRAADQGDQSFSVNRLAATRRGSGRRPAEGRGASSQFGARAEVPAWPAPRGRDHGGRRRGVRRKGLRRRDDDQDRRTGGHGDRLALPVLSKAGRSPACRYPDLVVAALDEIAARATDLPPAALADALVDLMLDLQSHRTVALTLVEIHRDVADKPAMIRDVLRSRIAKILTTANAALPPAKAEVMAAILLHCLKAVPAMTLEDASERRRRCDRPRSSDRRDRGRPDNAVAAFDAARRCQPRPRDAVHQRRPGHRPGAGGSVVKWLSGQIGCMSDLAASPSPSAWIDGFRKGSPRPASSA